MSIPAPLLLLSPPFQRHMPDLGRVLCDWDRIAPADLAADAVASHPVAALLTAARVGGRFWSPGRTIPESGLTLLCLPDRPDDARSLWQRALARQAAGGLLVVLPAHPSRRLQALGRAVQAAGARLVAGDTDPHPLLDAARTIWTDRPGLLAVLGLLRGLPVRRLSATGEEIAEDPARALSLLLSATLYADPFTGRPSDAAASIALLADWRRILLANRGVAVGVGMSLWKRRRIGQIFARADGGRLPFRRSATSAVRAAMAGRGAIAVWSTRSPAGLARRAAAAGIAVQRVEDGFIRSLGLGSDLLPPASVIVDSSGIYFDPGQPSDLESLLATHPFDDALRDRARRLIDRLVSSEISKYAAGGVAPRLSPPPGARVILVPGQVADDLSVRLGGAGMDGNLGLLAAVRAAEPDAFLVYRPHPDVDAGHRAGAIADADVLRLADTVSRGGSMTRLIAAVDEVHTLTSLAGFEALLRGRKVVAYGQPFYAGWGLTTDRVPVCRRTRILCVEELAAATLLLYPRYVDPRSGLPCGPEILIDRLGEPDLWRPSLLMRLRRMQGRARRHLGTAALRRAAPGRLEGAVDA